ncbi:MULTISPECIES: hypothetical protein [unclassified Streptomyces]|uniref:hypothetical protein n=1 Tax=unclassified Streptomyces TaxID=2593676 RepID=UPI002E195A0B|nr:MULTISPECIES: hypothetical protein [unclassified Streptomyces]
MTGQSIPPRWKRANWRRANLLAAIREQGGEWTTGRVKQLYQRRLGRHIYRSTIRRDLRILHADGHLTRHGDDTPHRSYSLRQEGATA